jgi:hypothetical protein
VRTNLVIRKSRVIRHFGDSHLAFLCGGLKYRSQDVHSATVLGSTFHRGNEFIPIDRALPDMSDFHWD